MSRRGRFVFLVAIFCAALVETRAQTPVATLAEATVVVFNQADADSRELAKFYAQKRGIPRDHLLGLICSAEEEISREEYVRTIQDPLRKTFLEKKWWNVRKLSPGVSAVDATRIRFVALIKGMPLKIRAAEKAEGDKPGAGPIADRNEASVDSELAALARLSPQISGATVNPYFQSYRGIMEWTDNAILLVCRLDAANADTVRAMINDAIETEQSGLWGRAYVDGTHATSGGFEMGDKWMSEIVEQCHGAGVPVVFEDTPALFPEAYPMSDCALYYGWYSQSVAGPFLKTGFRFRKGAIAVHIFSFSAASLRSNGNWVALLSAKGAAATVGNVYEPYLQLTTHLEIMNDRLLHGFTFAESAYMGSPSLSWMNVMIGDPLYRPYLPWLQLEAKGEQAASPSAWEMYHAFALKNSGKPTAEYRVAARDAAIAAKNAPMLEDLGAMEMRDGKFAEAAALFLKARSFYTTREDILRSVLEEADASNRKGDSARALQLIRSTIKAVSDTPTLEFLRKIEQTHSPPASPTPKP